MGYVDVPLILLSLAIVVAGQTIWSSQSKKKRALVAINQRNNYFIKLQSDCQKMTTEVNKKIEELELDNDRIKNKLKDCGFNLNKLSDTDTAEELNKTKTALEQKQTQLKSLDKELAEVCAKAGLDDNIPSDDLEQKLAELQSENRELESQLKKLGEVSLPTRHTDMDPEIMDYLKQEGCKFTFEQLDALYEKLLEEKVADPNKSLEAYEARIRAFDYEAEHQRLDIERKRIEKVHDREKRLYLDESKTFNEMRIEYCFKIPAVMEEYEALRELNDTEEKILRNCRDDEQGSKPDDSDQTSHGDRENHYP